MIVPMSLGYPDAVEYKKLRAAFFTNNGIIPPTSEIVETVRKPHEYFQMSDVNGNTLKEIPITALDSITILYLKW